MLFTVIHTCSSWKEAFPTILSFIVLSVVIRITEDLVVVKIDEQTLDLAIKMEGAILSCGKTWWTHLLDLAMKMEGAILSLYWLAWVLTKPRASFRNFVAPFLAEIGNSTSTSYHGWCLMLVTLLLALQSFTGFDYRYLNLSRILGTHLYTFNWIVRWMSCNRVAVLLHHDNI